MNALTSNSRLRSPQSAIDRFAGQRPDLVLAAPLMVYIVLLGVTSALPPVLLPAGIAARGILSVAVVWALRRHLPPLGQPLWPIALTFGAAAAWGWMTGQHLFEEIGLGFRLPIMPGGQAVIDPRTEYGGLALFRAVWWSRLLVAVLAVPIVEELFWRGFLLRALIDWHHFERVPLGKFTWFSFLGTSLISTLQHPGNWGVSILCWMLFNGVFYWTRSLTCLMILHGFTNLVLYLMAYRIRDWSFF